MSALLRLGQRDLKKIQVLIFLKRLQLSQQKVFPIKS